MTGHLAENTGGCILLYKASGLGNCGNVGIKLWLHFMRGEKKGSISIGKNMASAKQKKLVLMSDMIRIDAQRVLCGLSFFSFFNDAGGHF